MKRRRLVFVVASVLFVGVTATSSLAGPPLSTDCADTRVETRLPSQLFSINGAGMAVGVNSSTAYMWDGGTATVLAGLRSAQDINNQNQVVGWATNTLGKREAALWDNGVVTFLGTLGGESFAFAINDRSQVVGFYNDSSDWRRIHAFVWEDGVMSPLEELPGGLRSSATEINSDGTIVGWVEGPTSRDIHAALWDANGLHDLGTMGGTHASLAAINNSGEAVGIWYDESLYGSGQPQPFLWSDGVQTNLALPVDGRGAALDINDHGEIVGETANAGEFWRSPTVWSTRGDVITMGEVGFSSVARAINKSGVIVGEGNLPTSGLHGMMWSCGPHQGRPHS